MPITPQSLIPAPRIPEIATGPVVKTGVGVVSVRIRPGLTISVPTNLPLALGQMVSVAMPGGNIATPQILGVASGAAGVVTQVVV